MYEVSTLRKHRLPQLAVTTEHGALRKYPGGLALRFTQGDTVAEVRMSNADAMRLYRSLGGVLQTVHL